MTADGRACPASKPRDRRSDGVRSVVCSQMAVRLRQPASTPVTARDRTVNRLWRTPRRSRGSVMFLRTWARGWRDRADVVTRVIGAGSQDEGMTRHHSSSLRGPRPVPATHHPHQNGSDTPTHRPCRPPGIRAQEGRQIRVGEGSLRHVEVSQVARVAAPIIGGPRPPLTATTHPPHL